IITELDLSLSNHFKKDKIIKVMKWVKGDKDDEARRRYKIDEFNKLSEAE
ncbi:25062_t:CDS:1, partial [Gigaspora rosea]